MSKRERATGLSGGTGKKKLKTATKVAKSLFKVHRSGAPVNTNVTPAVQAQVDKAIINEKKRNAHYVDLALASYACDTTGSITLLATMAQGASQNQRIGKKAMYKSVQFRGAVYSGSTTTLADAAILLVYDRDPTNALPLITDILNTISSYSFNNDTNSDRFKIVRRWDLNVSGNSATPATGQEFRSFDEYVDMRNLPVQFGNAGTGAIGDVKLGALYLVTVGSGPAGTTAPILQCGARTRFIDLE